VSVRRGDDSLVLTVRNTIAPGKPAGADGIGLRNVRERLAVQFEGRANLVAGPSETLWVSEITLPEIHASPDRRSSRRMASWAAA
jgi:signal transduction histidine kinase